MGPPGLGLGVICTLWPPTPGLLSCSLVLGRTVYINLNLSQNLFYTLLNHCICHRISCRYWKLQVSNMSCSGYQYLKTKLRDVEQCLNIALPSSWPPTPLLVSRWILFNCRLWQFSGFLSTPVWRLLIRAIECFELAQLGSALMITVCGCFNSGAFFLKGDGGGLRRGVVRVERVKEKGTEKST